MCWRCWRGRLRAVRCRRRSLLAGPEGVGKRRTALAIAETLNCLELRTADDFEVDACGACASCRRIARGVHPDVIVLEPGETGTIKIDEIRDVIDRANYRPFEGRRRAVIVDEADTMMPSAQNALLKTLEEPRPGSVFVLRVVDARRAAADGAVAVSPAAVW